MRSLGGKKANIQRNDSNIGGLSMKFGESISSILEEEPFASAKYIAKLLEVSPTTVKSHIYSELHMKKYMKRFVSYDLSNTQKVERFQKSIELLKILRVHTQTNFDSLITLDESWFDFRNEAIAIYATS